MRIEDTDLHRLVPGATEAIYKILKIFGLNWDEGPSVDGPYEPYIQSQRVKTDIYRQAAEKLVKDGHAYYCFCPPESKEQIKQRQAEKKVVLKDPCRDLSLAEAEARLAAGEKAGIRLRLPDREKVSYTDFVLNKKIEWESRHLDEVMLLKSDGYPTYHLGVVVDDHLMEISHIIRGHDWLPSTPIHLFLFKYLGFELPAIGHLTDILDPAGGKLSKRKGSVSCEDFFANGFLPEAILNFIMLCGWAPKDNREIFSLEDFVKEFPHGNLQISNPIFNRKKLDWFNGYYLRQKTDAELLDLVCGSRGQEVFGHSFVPQGMSRDLAAKTIPLIKERIRNLGEFPVLTEFLVHRLSPQKEDLVGKSSPEEAKKMLDFALEKLTFFTSQGWQAKPMEEAFLSAVDGAGWKRSDFFMSLRVAITARPVSPPLFESMVLLGRDESLARIKEALNLLS